MRNLFIHKELQIVVLLVLKVLGQLLNDLLQICVGFLHIVNLITEEITLFCKFLFACNLGCKYFVHTLFDLITDVFQIINEHYVAQFFFLLIITASVWQVHLLIACDTCPCALLGAAEIFC